MNASYCGYRISNQTNPHTLGPTDLKQVCCTSLECTPRFKEETVPILTMSGLDGGESEQGGRRRRRPGREVQSAALDGIRTHHEPNLSSRQSPALVWIRRSPELQRRPVDWDANSLRLRRPGRSSGTPCRLVRDPKQIDDSPAAPGRTGWMKSPR